MHIMVHNIYILFIFIIENNERSVLNLDLKYELYELNLSFKISNKLERILYKLYNIATFVFTCNNQIVSCATTHRTPIYYFIFPLVVISKVCGSKMLNCV